ncbi:hypothetical protein JTB14_036324 [Gonioctena quinquepunctata]|nr:hypothetical protein JTB14_036324 [Gonioctena quinquepunctata]
MDLAQNDPKIINEVTNNVEKYSTDSPIIDDDNIIITELPNKVNYFNTFFVNIGSAIAMEIEKPDAQPEMSNTWVNNSIFLQPVSENELISLITSLNDESVAGIWKNSNHAKCVSWHQNHWPVDPDLFSDYMFTPAETTNIPIEQETPRTSAADNSSEYPETDNSSATATNRKSVPETRYSEVEPQLLLLEEIPGSSFDLLAIPLEVSTSVTQRRFISGQGVPKPNTQKCRK